jgi:predicted GNAT superfamily acetyltransferase
MGDEITIRPAASIADYHACQEAQRRAWGIADESYVIPIATMVGAQLHGGLVLGAFLPSGEAVGVSFAFLGRVEGRLCLYSQLTGIVPGWQAHGLGSRLKTTQRALALAAGVDLIAWAFDPLQAGNAHFNLAKLGATAARYVDDMYGPRTDVLNAGVPTDRLIAEWDLAPAPRADAPSGVASLPRLVETAERPDGLTAVAALHPIEGPAALLEIPPDIAALRARDPGLAEAWRQAVRDAFTTAFASGYRAVGFHRETGPSGRRCFYVLSRV